MFAGLKAVTVLYLTVALWPHLAHTADSPHSETEPTCKHFNDPDVLNITVRMPRSNVPTSLTTYQCYDILLPADRHYHFIGAGFVVDNYDVVHHMGLTICSDQGSHTAKPTHCRYRYDCGFVMTFYNQGVKSQCLDPNVGISFGRGYSHTAMLSIHWTNQDQRSDIWDGSGFVLYYTAQLRKEEAGIFTVGQARLDIPPGQENVLQQGICRANCTSRILTGPIHVTSALNHMHFLGREQNVTLFRQGDLPPLVLTNDRNYSYGHPVLNNFDPPVTIQPGDEIVVNCNFQSMARNRTTRFGPQSSDEMCFVYMTYYPAGNVVGTGEGWDKTCINAWENSTCDIVE